MHEGDQQRKSQLHGGQNRVVHYVELKDLAYRYQHFFETIAHLLNRLEDGLALGPMRLDLLHRFLQRLSGRSTCWGINDEGQLGEGTENSARFAPTEVLCLGWALQVALGANHACALLRNGTVRCWGDNQQGQLGDGTTENRADPVPVRGVAQAVELAAMANRSCARLRNGRVTCWGDGEGQGSAAADLGVEDVLQLAAGLGHLCLLVESSDDERAAPAPRSGGAASDAGAAGDGGDTASDAGGDASAEPDAPTGRVFCLGENDRGQLARSPETLEESDTPQAIVGLGGVVAITAGSMHSCAQRADGHVFCWGDDMSGQLGRIPSWIRPTPVEVRLPASE